MSKRKNRPYKRGEPFRDASLFVIACEGEKTERAYFEQFCSGFRRVKVVVLPTGNDHKSAPNHVLKRADDFVDEFGIVGEDDRVWLVIDMDRWKEATLSSIAKACEQKEKYILILSNPCFELWPYLHLEKPTQPLSELQNCSDLKAAIRANLGAYNPSNPDFSPIFPMSEYAISQAEKLDTAPADRFPNGTATRVYVLVKRLLELKK